jgi:hypothetical protein
MKIQKKYQNNKGVLKMKNLNVFTNDNTNGVYSVEKLLEMNNELTSKMIDFGFTNIYDIDDSILKFYAERIMDKN